MSPKPHEPSNLAEDEPRAPRVLVAEDEDDMRTLIALTLRRAGFGVLEAKTGAEVLEWFAVNGLGGEEAVDLIISDVRMPGCSGLDVLAALKRSGATTPVIIITAFGAESVHAEAYRLGAYKVLDKPFNIDVLRAMALAAVAI